MTGQIHSSMEPAESRAAPDVGPGFRNRVGRRHQRTGESSERGHAKGRTLIAEFDRRKGWSDSVTRSCTRWLNCQCGPALGAARGRKRSSQTRASKRFSGHSFCRGRGSRRPDSSCGLTILAVATRPSGQSRFRAYRTRNRHLEDRPALAGPSSACSGADRSSSQADTAARSPQYHASHRADDLRDQCRHGPGRDRQLETEHAQPTSHAIGLRMFGAQAGQQGALRRDQRRMG